MVSQQDKVVKVKLYIFKGQISILLILTLSYCSHSLCKFFDITELNRNQF